MNGYKSAAFAGGFLSVLFAVLLLCWFVQPKTAPATRPEPVTFAYFSFNFPAGAANARLVLYARNKTDGIGIIPASTNNAPSAAAVLTALSAEGWQFAWTDGREYLLRRPTGNWPAAAFTVDFESTQ